MMNTHTKIEVPTAKNCDLLPINKQKNENRGIFYNLEELCLYYLILLY